MCNNKYEYKEVLIRENATISRCYQPNHPRFLAHQAKARQAIAPAQMI